MTEHPKIKCKVYGVEILEEDLANPKIKALYQYAEYAKREIERRSEETLRVFDMLTERR